MLFQNEKIRQRRGKYKSVFLKSEFIKFSLCFCAIVFSFALSSCRNPQKIEMRSLLPNNAVAYLEIEDLGVMLASLTDSQAFQELAASKPDFSALENMQLAIAVTGFETSEENAVLNFKPQFVAVAETHLWSWQTVSFAENQLDKFVRKNYGEDAKVEKSKKNGGNHFSWTANDKRQVFAFVQGSLVYFGTDATTIEHCLAIKNGADDSLMSNESLSRAYAKNNLAFGYVSAEGIKKFADFAGVNVAVETTEESGGRNFIARILPQILQNTTGEIVWTATKTERGIEDKFFVALTEEVSSITKEILPAELTLTNAIEFLPPDFHSATRYNLRNSSAAWHSLLITTTRNTDALSGRFLTEFSDKLLEPYGISNAEKFLSSIDSEIITIKLDADGERGAAIVTIKDAQNLKASITREINFKVAAEKQSNAEIYFSEDKQTAAAFISDKLILGASESVLKCLQAKQSGSSFVKNPNYQKVTASRYAAATLARDSDTAEKMVELLARRKDENRKLATFYLTETKFTEKGIERRSVSDFGLIGTILTALGN